MAIYIQFTLTSVSLYLPHQFLDYAGTILPVMYLLVLPLRRHQFSGSLLLLGSFISLFHFTDERRKDKQAVLKHLASNKVESPKHLPESYHTTKDALLLSLLTIALVQARFLLLVEVGPKREWTGHALRVCLWRINTFTQGKRPMLLHFGRQCAPEQG